MREIVLVTGPPAAGKSTYVGRHAPPSAEVVDYDAIAQSLGSPDGWDHSPHIREATRHEVERRISRIAASGTPAYVIRSAPDPVERKRLADRIGATRIVVLYVPPDVAKARAAADGRPGWTANAIDRWHARFRPSNDPREQAPDCLGTGGRFSMTDNAPDIDAPDTARDAIPSDSTARAPHWDGEFDRERAERLVANLRAELADVKGKLRAREDAEKSELQRAQDRVAELERELSAARTDALVAHAARKHGLPDDLTRFIRGESAEEIEEAAATLAARLAPPAVDPVPGRPRPRLVPGHGGTDDGAPDFDPVALAARL